MCGAFVLVFFGLISWDKTNMNPQLFFSPSEASFRFVHLRWTSYSLGSQVKLTFCLCCIYVDQYFANI